MAKAVQGDANVDSTYLNRLVRGMHTRPLHQPIVIESIGGA